jgi:hypothetical protein
VDLVLSTTELWHLLEGRANETAAAADAAAGAAADAAAAAAAASSPMDLDLDDVEITLNTNPSDADGSSTSNTDTPGHISVVDYLSSLSPDLPTGADPLEAIFRNYSPAGLAFLTAVDSNAGTYTHIHTH